MEEVKIQELIDRCVNYFREHCYTESRISRYKGLWRTGIIRFMSEKGIESYSPVIGAEFKGTCHVNGTVRPQERDRIRSIVVLDDILTLGRVRKRTFTPVVHSLPGKIGAAMERFTVHLSNLRRSKRTIEIYRLHLCNFLEFLNQRGIHDINSIHENDILVFVSSLTTNKVNVVSALRVLFRFWKDEHIVEYQFEYLFEGLHTHRKERIPSFYTATEVIEIERSVSRSSGAGKRNYAMLLLASRLGLRAADIAGLKFSNIDWDRSMITLNMQKTDKLIELPLLADVGNAIVDYLRHGRHESPLQNVFLSERAPYVAATRASVCAAISKIICESGISTSCRHHGPHSMRHSLASAMLDDGTMLPVISESLGHRSIQTTLTYLKIDVKSLRKCALTVPPVADGFYMQRGGAFYG